MRTRVRTRAAAIAPPPLGSRSLRYHGVDIDYGSYDSGPPEGGCECGIICRCWVIYNAEVGEINYLQLAEEWRPQTVSERYGAQRLFAISNLAAHDFEVPVSGGYYGEEIDGIYLDGERAYELDQRWLQYKQLPVAQRLPYLLELEYEQVPEAAVGKNFVARRVPLERIIFGSAQDAEFSPGVVEQYTNMLSEHEEQRQLNEEVPVAVLVPEEGGYRVVDGQHRLRSAQERGQTHVRAYVARASATIAS